jgi:hypothetical protein
MRMCWPVTAARVADRDPFEKNPMFALIGPFAGPLSVTWVTLFPEPRAKGNRKTPENAAFSGS